jgi:predicted O-methyltransferase YrrM
VPPELDVDRPPAPELDALRDVQGWLTDDQARRLQARARAVRPGGRIVEIGSFHGRSTIALAQAAPAGVEIVAIDPHLGSDRGPGEIAEDRDTGESDHRAFTRNLTAAGVADRVRHVRLRSEEALGEVPEPIDLLYVDGAHRYGPALDDIVSWGARVTDGGTMLVHDSFSSIGVTGALLRTTVFGPRWRYAGRDGSLAEYRAARLGARLRARNALEQLALLPWFARNVALKVLIVARLRPGPFPY